MTLPDNSDDLKIFISSLIDAHEQELSEIRDTLGANNVKDFYWNDHLGQWTLTFNMGEDQEFDTKLDMLKWIHDDLS